MFPSTSASRASACSWVSFSFLTRRASCPSVTPRAFSTAASTNFWSRSLTTTGMSAAAIAWAISPPIVPPPTTAAFDTNIGLAFLRGVGAAEGYRGTASLPITLLHVEAGNDLGHALRVPGGGDAECRRRGSAGDAAAGRTCRGAALRTTRGQGDGRSGQQDPPPALRLGWRPPRLELARL